MKKNVSLFIILLIFSQIQAQTLTKNVSNSFKIYEYNINQKSVTTLKFSDEFTAVIFEIGSDQSFSDSYVRWDKVETKLTESDEIAVNRNGYIHSQMISFDGQTNEFIFYSGNLSGKIIIKTINSGKSPEIQYNNIKTASCEEPQMIPQSEWRAGLNPPNYSPINTETFHVILHHSASSNSVTDYVQQIRDFYIYHTEGNGWSDIGYNYVIAPDGTIFKGRDGLGEVEQDFVQGAHFCGHNSNTMGICMMGTYSDVLPTDTALASLNLLLSWKLGKDQLHPLDCYRHWAYDNDMALLPVIAGHRDGCATECPGGAFYAILEDVRYAVLDSLIECGLEPEFLDGCQPPASVNNNLSEVKPYNLKFQYDRILIESFATKTEVFLFDILGKKIKTLRLDGNQTQIVNTENLNSGIYILQIRTNQKIYAEKIYIH